MYEGKTNLILFEKKEIGDIISIWKNERLRQQGAQATARARCEFIEYKINDFYYKIVEMEEV